jgi:hypothetical protein
MHYPIAQHINISNSKLTFSFYIFQELYPWKTHKIFKVYFYYPIIN